MARRGKGFVAMRKKQCSGEKQNRRKGLNVINSTPRKGQHFRIAVRFAVQGDQLAERDTRRVPESVYILFARPI